MSTTRKISTVYEYTDAELNELGRRLANLMGQRQHVEAEKKAVASEFNSKLKGIDAEIEEVAEQRRTGEKEVWVECRLHRDREEKKRKWVNIDTGDVVLVEPFIDADYQLDLEETTEALASADSPFGEGYDAAGEAIEKSENPYDPLEHLQAFNDWNDGWDLFHSEEVREARDDEPDEEADEQPVEKIEDVVDLRLSELPDEPLPDDFPARSILYAVGIDTWKQVGVYMAEAYMTEIDGIGAKKANAIEHAIIDFWNDDAETK